MNTSPDPHPQPGITEATTPEEIAALCTAEDRYIECFHELLDHTEAVLVPASDLTADLRACTVAHNIDSTVAGTVNLVTTRELPWEATRSRISVRLTARNLALSAYWLMGVYLLTTPQRKLGESPEEWDVQGADKVSLLDNPVGRSYVLTEGTSYCVEMARVLTEELGETRFIIDQAKADKLAPADRVWALSDSVTWLQVLNEMAGELAYRPWWADRDGTLRTDLDVAAASRPKTFEFDTTNVGVERTYDRPLSTVPNVWVFYRRSTSQGLPVDDDGIYEVTNQTDGPTSIAQRGRRQVKPPVALDAADEDDFKAQADAIVSADMNLAAQLTVSTVLVPSMWHGDVHGYSDPALGAPLRVETTQWSAELVAADGVPKDMDQTWKAA